ncbi:hypothetical protein J2D69_02745 [Lysinibacillus sphaericus]|nr:MULTISPECIES: hypothetical protein [Lysinibacillus]MBE5082077.1 hypothetical protein [Bacillus thuringiensis]MCS1396964.1 hypothetical protein [Lysinibacillus sp. PB211]MDR0158774.1 hypothetical protein [Lysinibacillus sphaericus]QPA50513.1 hypothetical protein INQ54_02765 [Lysinibacillus sphaericus]QTB18627.1 hypothetical protein J2D69_02745 [Lysinibacillus sphaericus]
MGRIMHGGNKRDKTLIHLLFSSYTIGFVLGGLGFFLTEIKNIDFQFNFSKESVFCFLILSPIIYWVYRYSGRIFDVQSMKVKLLYFVLWIIGMAFGIIFFDLAIN